MFFVEKEIIRIIHDNIQYIIGVYFWDIELKFPMPFISVTMKSSKKFREKKQNNKHESHFNLIKINNPISFYRKVYNIFSEFLKDYDYVIYSANNDSKYKRENVYKMSLEKMGFKLIYVYKRDYFLMAKNEINIKKKDIKKMLDFLEY